MHLSLDDENGVPFKKKDLHRHPEKNPESSYKSSGLQLCPNYSYTWVHAHEKSISDKLNTHSRDLKKKGFEIMKVT